MALYKIRQYRIAQKFRRLDDTPQTEEIPVANVVSICGHFGTVVTDGTGEFYYNSSKSEDEVKDVCASSGIYKYLGEGDVSEYGAWKEHSKKLAVLHLPKDLSNTYVLSLEAFGGTEDTTESDTPKGKGKKGK